MKKTFLRLCLLGGLVLSLLVIVPVAVEAAPGGGGGGGGTNTTTVRWGPIHVPGADANGPGMLENTIIKPGGCSWIAGYFTNCQDMQIEKPCEDCYLTRIVPNLMLSGTNTPANYNNMAMLHHVVNMNFSRPDVTCRPNWFGDSINQLGAAEGGNERFFAAGNERTVMTLPSGYGYYVGRGDEWGLLPDIMNMSSQARDFDLVFTFDWVKRANRATPVWLDIDNCADSEVTTPAGYSDTEWSWRSTISGTVLSIGGHVHDHGVSLAAENVGKQLVCTSVAGYEAGGVGEPVGPGSGTDAAHPSSWWTMTADDHPTLTLDGYRGHIAGMTTCDPNQTLSSGDTLRLHAQYNRADVGESDMGIMIMYVG